MRVAVLGWERSVSLLSTPLRRAGHDTVAWVGRGPLTQELERGTSTSALADAIHGAEIVISLGWNDQALHDLVMRQGLLDTIAPGSVHVSGSLASVPAVQHLMEMHEARARPFVSAPFFQPADAAADPGCIVAAGEAKIMSRVQPLLDAIGTCIVVGSTPWHANLISTEILRLTSGGPDNSRAVTAKVEAAGIPLALFRRAVHAALCTAEAGGAAQPAAMSVDSAPPDRPLVASRADLAGPAE